MRKSREFVAKEKEWVGKRVRYYLLDVLDKANHGKKLDGPFTGVVRGVTSNGALVQDRLEGNTGRNSVKFTGQLIVLRDHTTSQEDYVEERHAEINA